MLTTKHTTINHDDYVAREGNALVKRVVFLGGRWYAPADRDNARDVPVVTATRDRMYPLLNYKFYWVDYCHCPRCRYIKIIVNINISINIQIPGYCITTNINECRLIVLRIVC